MANERFPEDPFRSGLSDDDFNRTSRYDRDLPPVDRDFDGGPSGGKVALFAVGIALILGAVFYGLNNTSTHQATNPPPTQSAQSERAAPQAPSGINKEPGTTTGSAPSQSAPPATAPSTMNKPSDGAPK